MRSKTSDAKLIALFLDMLAAEQGAGNTLDAYRRDLTDFAGSSLAPARVLQVHRPRRCGTILPTSTRAASNRPAWHGGCRQCGICSVSS
jgi:hypothetical protein